MLRLSALWPGDMSGRQIYNVQKTFPVTSWEAAGEETAEESPPLQAISTPGLFLPCCNTTPLNQSLTPSTATKSVLLLHIFIQFHFSPDSPEICWKCSENVLKLQVTWHRLAMNRTSPYIKPWVPCNWGSMKAQTSRIFLNRMVLIIPPRSPLQFVCI